MVVGVTNAPANVLTMCANCVTTLDSIALNAVGIAALATHAKDRYVLHRDPGRGQRAERIRRQNVAFIASMGLDPVAVLGPAHAKPSVPQRPDKKTNTRQDALA